MRTGTIYQPTTIVSEEELELAASSRIDSYCYINASGGAHIRGESVIHVGSHLVGSGRFEMGPRSAITYNCVILTSTADLAYPASTAVPEEQRRSLTADVVLERETFVGSGSIVMPGVTIAEGGVVAANTYVDEDVPPWSVRYPDGSTGERPRESERFPD